MSTLVKTEQNSEITPADHKNAFVQFDNAGARFLMTRKSKHTRKRYEHALRQYRAHAAALGLHPLRADALIAYNEHSNAQRRDAGGLLANDTIRARLKAVQSFFSWLYTFDLTPLKPGQVSELLTMPPARKLSPRDILTEDEAARLLAAAEGAQEQAIIRAMLDAGLRLSEALSLRAGDIYAAQDRYFIHVAKGKGDKARDVPINKPTFDALADYAAALGLDVLNPADAAGPLFDDLYPRAVQRMVERVAGDAGIAKRITPHSLRHTLGNTLRALGYPLELVGEILGHASYDTTKLYTRPAAMLRQIQLPTLPWGE